LNLLDTSPEIHDSAIRLRLYDETFIEIERAKLDLLKVSDSIATARRDFFENGVSTSAEVRSARDAEQRRPRDPGAGAEDRSARVARQGPRPEGQTFLESLITRVQALGRADLVEEAKTESLQALDAAGLRVAYSMKGPA
jgi:hypothetical protein